MTTSPTLRKINLEEAFGRIPEPWKPHLAGRVNEVHVKLAKLDGEFIWHGGSVRLRVVGCERL